MRIHTSGPQRTLVPETTRLARSRAPLDRHNWPPLRSAPAAPEDAPLEIEQLGLRAEPEPQQELWCQPCDMMAGGAIDHYEIATPKILDPR